MNKAPQEPSESWGSDEGLKKFNKQQKEIHNKATLVAAKELKNSLQQAVIDVGEAHAELMMAVEKGADETFDANTKARALHSSAN